MYEAVLLVLGCLIGVAVSSIVKAKSKPADAFGKKSAIPKGNEVISTEFPPPILMDEEIAHVAKLCLELASIVEKSEKIERLPRLQYWVFSGSDHTIEVTKECLVPTPRTYEWKHDKHITEHITSDKVHIIHSTK